MSSLPDVHRIHIKDGERYQYEGQELIAMRMAEGGPNSCQDCDLSEISDCLTIYCRDFVFLTPINYITRRLLE